MSWNMAIVLRGLELNLLDANIPAHMHAELAYAVASCIDRWVVCDATPPETALELARTILPRMLGAPSNPLPRASYTPPE